MKIVDDIFSSIAGTAKTRVSDPFIGTFMCSWLLCNWNYLALLAWGEGNATERVSAFYIYLSQTPIFGWNSLFVFPFLIALFYLFVFPWLSLVVKFIQRTVNEKLHLQAVGVDLSKVTQQENLNKAKLKADPDKQFLEQLVQQDLDKKNEILEHIRQRTIRFEAKSKEALSQEKEQEAKTQDAENKAKLSELELDKKKQKVELDRVKFESDSAKARATLASHRFPSAYNLMLMIEESLKEDSVQVSLKASGEIVAALFGYESFRSLLQDNEFNNETLEKVRYVYYDDGLAKRLEQIVLDEGSDNEDFSADMIFGHFEMLFEEKPFELITDDRLAEYSKEMIENDPYDIFNSEGTSGAIADSDTQFEYVDDIDIESYDFDDGFHTIITANASGHHHRESDVSGRTMSVKIETKSRVLVGKYGLGPIEQEEISGTLDDYD